MKPNLTKMDLVHIKYALEHFISSFDAKDSPGMVSVLKHTLEKIKRIQEENENN